MKGKKFPKALTQDIILVFSSFNIGQPNQISKSEDPQHLPQKFRFFEPEYGLFKTFEICLG